MLWARPIRAVGAVGEKFLDRALCVFGAVLFSQVPEFFQQYLQRLGGHLDEARLQLEQFQQVAAQSGETLDRLIANSNGSAEPEVVKLGRVMTDTLARVDALAASESAIRGASIWGRPFEFLRHIDLGIAHATWSAFRPAVPTTFEGLVYAAVGMFLMLLIYYCGVRYGVRRAWRARAARKQAAKTVVASL